MRHDSPIVAFVTSGYPVIRHVILALSSDSVLSGLIRTAFGFLRGLVLTSSCRYCAGRFLLFFRRVSVMPSQ
jgi:hypothetical protein